MNKIIEIIVEWIGDNYPLVFAFIAVIWITWKVSRLYAKQKSINEKVDDLPCTKHREDIDTSHNNYNELLRVTNEVNVTVSGMEDRLIEVSKWIIKKTVK